MITRSVNTLECDTIGITEHPSISNRWLVPGGWYDFEASAPYNAGGGYRTGIRAYDSGGTTLWTEWGESGYVTSNDPNNIRSDVLFRRCLCVPTYIEVVQYVTQTASNSNELGEATSQTSVQEKYTRLIISDACC